METELTAEDRQLLQRLEEDLWREETRFDYREWRKSSPRTSSSLAGLGVSTSARHAFGTFNTHRSGDSTSRL